MKKNEEKNKVVLIMSGGLDSTVLLNKLHKEGMEIHGLTFNYGQRHEKEIDYAHYWGKRMCKKHMTIDIDFLKEISNKSALTADVNLPKEHYTHENQKITVVPNRNMIMLSIAIAYAEENDMNRVYYAAHKNDHAIYPDCRPEFAYQMSCASMQATYNEVQVIAPFIFMPKSSIVRLGKDLNVDFKKTWSCYAGLEEHCGTCATCQERIEAFKVAKIKDPTLYRR